MEELLIGILGGFIVGIITAIVRSTLSGRLKLFQIFIPAQIRKTISWEYKNPKKAERSVARDIETSSTMRVFCLKGATFCNEHESATKLPYRTLHRGKNLSSQKYLISSSANPYINTRAIELNISPRDLSRGVATSIQHLENEQATPNSKVELRKHNETVRFRLYIFDENLYLSYQPVNVKGCDCSVQKYPKGSNGYIALEAYFEELWEKYKI